MHREEYRKSVAAGNRATVTRTDSLGRGDVTGATLFAASMLPIVGDAIGKGGKIARAGLKYGNEITIVLEISDSSSTTIKAGEFVNRVFDSNYGKLEGVSGPLGRSFSPGSGINTTAKENIIERGLDIYNTNNAEIGIVYRVTEDIPAIARTALDGTAKEILIEPEYWGRLEKVFDFPIIKE